MQPAPLCFKCKCQHFGAELRSAAPGGDRSASPTERPSPPHPRPAAHRHPGAGRGDDDDDDGGDDDTKAPTVWRLTSSE